MIVVIGEFRMPLERRTEAEAAMQRVIALSRAEAGCIAYAYAEDVLEPGLFRVSEAWESREALAVHFEAAHMKDWQRERAELGMTGRKVSAYPATYAEEL
jgi:quinol monooxygenase YgiN